MGLAQELKTIRSLRGHSLRDVESATGISNAYLSQLERSKASNPSPKVLAKLAEYYRVRYESLMAAAGYLNIEPRLTGTSETIGLVGSQSACRDPLQQAIMDTELDREEWKLVAEYIAFLRSRKT